MSMPIPLDLVQTEVVYCAYPVAGFVCVVMSHTVIELHSKI